MKNKYTISNLQKAIKNPALLSSEFKRILRKTRSQLFDIQHGPAFDVMGADWDILILLDACRYDYFKSTIDMDGKLRSIVSPGAHSWEFMNRTFIGKNYHDTVYITANPHAQKLDDEIFYTIENILDAWDSEVGTVLPEEVVEAAVEAGENYPNKRLIIHFMQPHEPHLGPTAKEIRERIELKGWNKHHGNPNNKIDVRRDGTHTWQAVKDGTVSIEEIRKAYSESLDLVLDHVSNLIDSINGRAVISSDHGEMLGERGVIRRRFGHPHDIYTPELRIVPWFILPSDERRNIKSETSIGFEKFDHKIVNDRLRSLGYRPE